MDALQIRNKGDSHIRMRVGFLHIDIPSQTTEFRELATRMVKSVLEHMPFTEIVQMSDFNTKPIPGIDGLRPLTIGEDFMPYRLRHLAEFEGEAIFLDTDIIVRRNLREAFNEQFDVGLTKREYQILHRKTGEDIAKAMPYNTGVMFSRKPDFFWEAYKYCKSLPQEKQQWWGDQISVNHIAKQGNYSIHEFPCEIWNRVPVRVDDYKPETYVTHYKGDKRKAWMLA